MHSPQPMHFFGSITAFSSRNAMADWEQCSTQSPHPTHFFRAILGDTSACWTIFPRRDAQPMPKFLTVRKRLLDDLPQTKEDLAEKEKKEETKQ